MKKAQRCNFLALMMEGEGNEPKNRDGLQKLKTSRKLILLQSSQTELKPWERTDFSPMGPMSNFCIQTAVLHVCATEASSLQCMCSAKSLQLSQTLRHSGLQPPRLLCPWGSPGKNAGVGCHYLLQGIFQMQGSNLSLLTSPSLSAEFFTNSTTWEL